MNVRANILGLGTVISVIVGLCLLLLKGKPAPTLVEGVAIGCGCSFLYLMGLLVGEANAPKK